MARHRQTAGSYSDPTRGTSPQAPAVAQAFEAFVALGEDPLEPARLRALAERWWHDDVIYEEDPKWPGANTFSGRERVLEAFSGYRELLSPQTAEVLDLVQTDDEFVVVVRFAGVSTANRLPFDHRWAYRVRLRGDRIAWFRACFDADEAVSAALADVTSRPG